MKESILKRLIKELVGPADPEMEKIQWQPSSGGYAFPSEAKKNPEAFAKRWQASVSLGELGAFAVPALIKTLNHRNPIVVIAAQHALRDIGLKAAPAVPALTANLRHPAWAVRRTAVWALARCGKSAASAVPALLACLKSDDDFHNRAAAAWCLHVLGEYAVEKSPETIAELAEALGDPEEAVRLNAATALGALGHSAKSALPELVRALKHSSQPTRIYAALAIGRLGTSAKDVVADLTKALATISDDTHAREKIRGIIKNLTGQKPSNPPEPKPLVKACFWDGLKRDDFFMACQPLLTQCRDRDQNIQLQAFLNAKMCNAFCFWPDHTWYNIPIPTPEQMKRWHLVAMWYFFTENIFNPKNQVEWGFKRLREYNLAMINQILRTGKIAGKNRCVWSVGHEHFDSVAHWGRRQNGLQRALPFNDKQGGYEFYRQWITTDIHKQHWNSEYANFRPNKFYNGWDVGEPATWESIRKYRLDLKHVQMMSGGIDAVLAHAAFDILPQIEWFWWECQITGTSLPIGAAYLRGASRQYGKKWLMDCSPWSPVFGNMKFDAKGNNIGGVTDNQQMRSWVYGYLAGADCVFQEASGITHFYNIGGSPEKTGLTSTGKTAKAVADFCFRRCQERGVPYQPVGILLEHEHGFSPVDRGMLGKGPWYKLAQGEGEWASKAFWEAVYPGHSRTPDPALIKKSSLPMEKEPTCLHGSAFGDVFDVLTDKCSGRVLKRYPRIIVLGGIQLKPQSLDKLAQYVRNGGEVMINAANLAGNDGSSSFSGARLLRWTSSTLDKSPVSVAQVKSSSAKVILSDDNGYPLILENKFGRGKIILVTLRHGLSGNPVTSDSGWHSRIMEFVKAWIRPVYPVQIPGRAGGSLPHYMLNRFSRGWLLGIGNHYRGPFKGKVIFALKNVKSIRELWTQKDVKFTDQGDKICFQAVVPEYSFRVFRVTTNP